MIVDAFAMESAGSCLLMVVAAAGCGGGASLTGGGDGQDHLLTDDGSVEDATVDGAGEDGGADQDSTADTDAGDDGGGDDAQGDDVSFCPVWAVPKPTGGMEDGSENFPFGGLDRALAGRGACDTIILRDGTPESPFDAAVNIDLEAGEALTIEGESAVEALAELDAHDDIGLFVTGEGTLVLRHLAVRGGWGSGSGCLDAQVRSLRLEDTEFSDCRAEGECSAVLVWADETEISDSSFLRNEAGTEGPYAAWPPGVVCLDGPPDTAHILVERSRFEDNRTDMGAALSLQGQTLDAVVRDCLFARNHVRLGMGTVTGTLGELSHNRFEDNEAEQGDGDGVRGAPETRVVHNLFIENRSCRGEKALSVTRGLVANNLFIRNGCGDCPDMGCGGSAVWIVTASNVDLRNNTFVDNASGDDAAHLTCDTAYGEVRSNLFVGGAGAAAVGMVYHDWSESAEMTWNAWWDAPEPVWGEGVRLGEGNFEADPLFAGDDDFHLGVGSAAIDAGDPGPLLADTDGTRNDIGAFGGPEGDWTPLPEGGAP
jgi:hypothetical protein